MTTPSSKKYSDGFLEAFWQELLAIRTEQKALTAEMVAARCVKKGHYFSDGRCYGSLMQAAHKTGLIRHFSVILDQRASRHHGLQRVWYSTFFDGNNGVGEE